MSKETDAPEQLSAGQLFEEFDGAPIPIVTESRVVIPKKGKLLDEDGAMKIAIIRPCISRGKRLGGLPPIYEAQMLEKYHGVFANVPMYMDHVISEALSEMAEDLKDLSPELFAVLQEKARTVKELGGRVIETSFDPTLTFEDDEEFGFRPGGIVGRAIPQPEPLKMLEADPGILQCSINAYLTGARRGNPSWSTKQKGMVVEGLRKAPRPSVDWVFRGGAGGRPLLQESDEFREAAVSLLESAYNSDAADHPPRKRKTEPMKDKNAKPLNEMNLEELQEHLKSEGAAELAESIAKTEKVEPTPPTASEKETVSKGDVASMIKEGLSGLAEEIGGKLEESATSVEERAAEMVREREESRVLETAATKLLAEAKTNGLPPSLAEEIGGRYAVLPSGATPGLKVAESDLEVTEDDKTVKLSEAQVVERRVRADIDHGLKILREAGSPVKVEGFGAEEEETDENGKPKKPKASEGESVLEQYADRHGIAPEKKVSETETPKKETD